MARGATVFVTK